MWFYKIDGVLDGFTFPEDRGTRSRAAQEFQSKQTLFSKKLQGKCYITVSQIKGGRITFAPLPELMDRKKRDIMERKGDKEDENKRQKQQKESSAAAL